MKRFLGRNKVFVLLLIAFIILRLPSLFEGFWYVDEGFYAAQAEGILRGKELYLEAWDHKPPLMVWIYVIGGFFGWDIGHPLIKFVSIVLGIVTIFLLYRLFLRAKIRQSVRYTLLTIAVVLLGTPILEGNLANTELFFIPITTGILYLALYLEKPKLVGFLLLLSFLIKPQAFIESIAIISLVLIYDLIRGRVREKLTLDKRYYVRLLTTFLAMLTLYIAYLLSQGALTSFVDAVFVTNFVYIESEDGAVNWNILKVLSAGAIFLWMAVRAKLQKISRTEFVVYLTLTLNVVLVTLSGRPYPHYLIQIVPSMLFAIALLTTKSTFGFKRIITISGAFLLLVLFLFSRGLDIELLDEDRLRGHRRYYMDFPLYLAGDKSTASWFWKHHSSNDWTEEFVDHFEQHYFGLDYYYYGEQPWIFTQLSGNFVNKYLVWYHLDYSEEKMLKGIEDSNEATIIVVDEYSRRKRSQFFENLEQNFTLLEHVHNYTIYVNNE